MNRKTILGRIKRTGESLRDNAAKRETLRWTLATLSFQLRATYPAGGEKAFLAAAATESGFAESDIGNLVRAYEVRSELTAAQLAKVSTWTTDAMLTLRGKAMTPAKRNQLIAKAEKAGTQNVKRLREMKAQVVGSTSRNRGSKTDRNIALAKSLAKDFERTFKSYDGALRLAFIAGVQFAQDKEASKDRDIAAALTYASAQVRKAAPVVAN